MTNVNHYKEIIQASFLTDKDKETLIQHLDTDGVTEAFITLFNELLIAETDIRIASLEKDLEAYESDCAQLDSTYSKKKDELEKKLEDALSSIEKTDLKNRTTAMEMYDSELKKLQNEIMGELKKLNAKHSVRLYENAYKV